VIGAVIGTIAAVAALVGAYMIYQRRTLTKKRLARLKTTHSAIMNRSSVYGVDDEIPSSAPSVVMYTVNMPGRNPSALTSKKAFPPQTRE
jgi:hypothetical protein